MLHTNSGRRIQVMPGARSVCTVTMKFMPVMIEEKPTTKTPSKSGNTSVGVVVL